MCRASVLALAGSRRAALPGVGGIRPWPFLGGVVNIMVIVIVYFCQVFVIAFKCGSLSSLS